MKSVVLYGAPDCHLCAVAKQKLARVRRVVPFDLQEVNIRLDPLLKERYGTVIPVVCINGREALVFKVTEFALLRELARS